MTTAPDPAEITPPTDPAAYGRRRGRGLAFWAMIIGALVCVAIGVALARYVPRLWAKTPVAAEAPLASTPAPAEPASLQPAVPLAGAAPDATAVSAAPSAEIAALQGRLQALETSQGRTVGAAAAALAAATLGDATQGSGPFEAELSALQRVLPTSPEVGALRAYAETGVPSRAALAAEFNAAAAKSAVAARDPGERAGFVDRALYALSSIITIRRVGATTGDGPDALLARAGESVAEGDIETALKTVRGLPPKAADALAPWRERAQQRVTVDRQVAAIRAQALSDLMAVSRAQP